MDILLIDPPFNSLKGATTEYGYNVGVASLAAYLREKGIESAILSGDLLMDQTGNKNNIGWNIKLDEYARAHEEFRTILSDENHYVWEKIADIIGRTSPGAVGITYFTPLASVVERIIGIVKQVDRNIVTIAGSYHPTFCPEEVMSNPDIDFVVRGEGEIPLCKLMNEMKKDEPDWSNVPGINYRDKSGNILSTPDAERIDNLDELPFIARDLVLDCDYSVYRGHSIYTARGCPYSCAFCADNSFWKGKTRRRSVDNVIKEMKLLKEVYKAGSVDIIDGTFTYDKNYLRAFCNAMIDNKLGLKWQCTARCDCLDEELLHLMKDSGCSGILLGFESGSERILEYINKKETVETLVSGSKLVRKSGIPSVGTFMMGMPEEREEDLVETIDLLTRVRADFIDINCFVPVSGSRIYDDMDLPEKQNIDWEKTSVKSYSTNFSKYVSDTDFKRLLKAAFKVSDKVRRKSLIRLGARAVLEYISAKLRRLIPGIYKG